MMTKTTITAYADLQFAPIGEGHFIGFQPEIFFDSNVCMISRSDTVKLILPVIF